MKLFVKDRIVLLGILPKEGDFQTLKQLREFREVMGFTDQETAMLKFVTNEQTGMINWTEPGDKDDPKPYNKEFEIEPSIMAIIVGALKQLDAEKKLTNDTFEIYEKFMTPEEEIVPDSGYAKV